MKLKFRKLDENNEEDVVQFNELMDDLTIHAKNKRLLMEKIKEINKTLPTYKYIKNLITTKDEFIKTTTAKVKRFKEIEI